MPLQHSYLNTPWFRFCYMSSIHVCFCSERPFYDIERRCQMSLQLSPGDFQQYLFNGPFFLRCLFYYYLIILTIFFFFTIMFIP